MKSQLAKFIPTSMDTDKIKREAWQQDGILVVVPEQKPLLKNRHIEAINEIGDLLYGSKRK